MKVLLRLLDKVRPNFEEGGKLRLFHPLYGAMEHFFFAPSQTTVTAPHVRDPLDLKRFMSMVIISLVRDTFGSMFEPEPLRQIRPT